MNTEALIQANDRIKAVLLARDTSNWLKSALLNCLERDLVDAVNDADILFVLLEARLQATLDAECAAVEADLQQDYINRFERHC